MQPRKVTSDAMEHSVKLWMPRALFTRLEREANALEWHVPHLIRRLLEDALEELEAGKKRLP